MSPAITGVADHSDTVSIAMITTTNSSPQESPSPRQFDRSTPYSQSSKLGVALEVDTSSLGEGKASEWNNDSTSLTASIVDYEFENGRRYHAYKAGHYPLPNDETELDRLDLQHHICTLLLKGELNLAPVSREDTVRALDLGCGTGLWAIEFADRFPNAMVTGVDLSPIQPIWIPENVRFEVDDIESEWLYKEDHFDYIHSRILIGAIDDWPQLLKRSYKHLKPGGWVEVQDLDPDVLSDDGTHKNSTYHLKLVEHLCRGAKKYGKDVPHWQEFERHFRQAGFVDVHTVLYKIPMNEWPKDKHLKEVGKYQLINYSEGYEAISVGFFTRALGWNLNEVQVLLARVRAELANRSIHAYKILVVCYGRKPTPAEIIERSKSVPPQKKRQRTAAPRPDRAKSEVVSYPFTLSTDHASVLRPPLPPPLRMFADVDAAHRAILGSRRSDGSASPHSPSRSMGSNGQRTPDRKEPPIVPVKPKYLRSNKVHGPSKPSPAITITSLLQSNGE